MISTRKNIKMSMGLSLILIAFTLTTSCVKSNSPESIDLAQDWRFSPDEKNSGMSEKWFDSDFDDSNWALLDAGKRWEDLGYPDLDSLGWYRKSVNIPVDWEGKDVWIKFGAVNDSYELYINGESVSFFGEANISFSSKPSFTEISKNLKYGESNLITVKVIDWGNSGGLWRLPVVITTDEKEVNSLFKPISDTPFIPEDNGYELFWQDQFEGDKLNPEKWAVRGVGPRAVGYVSPRAVKVKDGFLELSTFIESDSVLTGIVGTMGLFMTKYGYFECRAQLQKSKGNWAAFWMQSPGIAQGEDPAKYGTEIDIMEYFKKLGNNMISHNLHWAYGPNQQTTGSYTSVVDGVDKGFHTFSAEWTPEKYAFFVDGFKYHEVTRAISHIEEYIILSMEIPKTMEELSQSNLPDVYIVDYVKVYKKKK